METSAVERWRSLVEARRVQMDAAYARLNRTSADFWSRRAGRFRELQRSVDASHPLVRRVRGLMPENGSVLDVGAGTGRYALPLARGAGSVLALDPSADMLGHLRTEAAAAGLWNIRLIEGAWLEQQADVPQADVVLCANVLYPHAEIERWLSTLTAQARRAVVLEMLADWGEPPVLMALWNRYHAEPRVLQPTYFDAYLVLHELGVPANVEVYQGGSEFWRFDSLEGAIAAAREHLILPEDEAVDREVSEALSAHLIERDGALFLPSERPVGIVWWERTGPRLSGARL